MSAEALAKSFLDYAATKLRDHFAQIRRCTSLLGEEQAWLRPNASSNSTANLLLHLAGNVRQWIVGGIGGRPVERDRQAEFDRDGGATRQELIAALGSVVDEACAVLAGMDGADLLRHYRIQAYDVTGIAAVMHVVEHFSFHTGQIVTATKWLLDVDLSLYDEHGHRRDGRAEDIP